RKPGVLTSLWPSAPLLIVYRRGSRETHYGPKLLIHLIKSILVLNCAARTKIFILLRSCEGIARGRAGREPTGGGSKAVGQKRAGAAAGLELAGGRKGGCNFLALSGGSGCQKRCNAH